jgi:hypothetical protein
LVFDSGMHCTLRPGLALVLFGLACGSDGSGDTLPATTVANTSDAGEMSTADDDGDDDDDDDTSAATTTTTSSSSTDPDDGTTGGTPCQSNADCSGAERCDFGDESCGTSGVAGTCLPRPTECDNDERPVCGCDDELYNSSCHAAEAGTDIAFLGSCETPNGAFVCGYSYCILDEEYCSIQGGGMPTATCIALPPVCQPPGCNCLADCCECDSTACCEELCTNDGGALTYVCPG